MFSNLWGMGRVHSKSSSGLYCNHYTLSSFACSWNYYCPLLLLLQSQNHVRLKACKFYINIFLKTGLSRNNIIKVAEAIICRHYIKTENRVKILVQGRAHLEYWCHVKIKILSRTMPQPF